MKFRKKPGVVEAWQLTHEIALAICEKRHPLPEGITMAQGSWHSERKTVDRCRLNIQTPNGRVYAEMGDWIMKDVAGEFYPCRADIFEQSYDPIEPPDDE